MSGPRNRPIIAVVSKSDAAGGGASTVAESLSRLLMADDRFDCHHWLGFAGGQWQAHYRKLHGGAFLRLMQQGTNWFSLQAGYPDFFTPELLIHLASKRQDYDLYHFHDISRAFSPIALRWLGKRKPVLFTIHDCTIFTGGCLYPMGCEAFLQRCDHCPQLDVWPLKTRFDRTGWMQDYKRQTASAGLFIPIAPSNWMADEAVKSGMFGQRPEVIPYCVDIERFRPRPRSSLRQSLGLPTDRFIVLMNVHNFADPKKGVADAIEAVRALSDPPLVLALGRVSDADQALFDGIDARFAGFVTDRDLVVLYCAAADVLLFPTYADNLPNAVLEAMASGTPTVGYATGGVPDMIENDENGWLAPTGDIGELTRGLEFARSNPEALRGWGARGRQRAVTTFSPRRFLDAHTDLYQRVLSNTAELLPHLAERN